jgi:GT2 family glycosyltransferase
MKVWVIVLNWNGVADTEVCLASLLDAEPRPHGIVVVDNGSRAGEVDRLRTWAEARGAPVRLLSADPTDWPAAGDRATRPGEIVLLASSTNRGFSGGNNVGLVYAEADPAATHFLLLNNDATVSRSYFADLESGLAAYPDTGLASGTIYEMNAPHRLWYAGGHIVPLRTIAVHHLEAPASDATIATGFICGCSMLISAATLVRLGHLPECYFPAYAEDAEYSQRALDDSIPVLYVPRAIAYHQVGASLGKAAVSPRVTYMLNRHRGFWARRNLRGAQRLGALLYLVITKPGRALVDALRGRPRTAWAVLTGTLDGLVSPRARDGS